MKKSLLFFLPFLFSIVAYAQPTEAAISVSGGTGTGGAFIVGNTVTAQWDNNIDGATGVSAVTFDFTEFGGGAAVVASDIGGGVYEAAYTIAAPGSTESTTADVSVTVVATTGGGSVTDNEDHTVDDVLPTSTVAIDSDPISLSDLSQVVTVTYSEAMDAGTSPTIGFDNSVNFTTAGDGAWSTVTFANDTWTETFNHDGTAEELAAETVTVPSASGATDVAGNSDIGNTSASFLIDTQGPSATVAVDSDPISPSDLVQVVTVTYDEAMDAGTNPSITFSSSGNFTTAGDGAWSTVTFANDTWTETFNHNGTSEQSFTETADVASASGATDVVGNDEIGNSSPTFVLDTQAPTATVTTDSDPIYLGDLAQVVTVTYDEPMDAGTNPTITFGTSANFTTAGDGAWSGGNTIWTETFNHDGTAEEIGTETAVVASSSGATDVVGIADIGDTSPSFVVDTQAPTATVTTDSDPIYLGDLTQVVTVTYDEPMDAGTNPTITFGTSANFTTAGDGVWSGGNTIWTETFNHDGTAEEIAAETAVVASSSGATDVAGNADIGDTSPSFLVDTQAPSATVAVDSNPISPSDLVQVVTVTYDEAMDAGTNPSITFSSSGNFTTAGDGAWSTVTFTNDTWTETFNHSGAVEQSFTETADVASASGATDVVGNDEIGDSSPAFVLDTQAPTATVTTDSDPIYLGDLTQVVTVSYDESMDAGTNPTITFNTSANFTTAGDGAWSTVTFTNDTWTETFNHDGTAEEIATETAIVASASGATDVVGIADIGNTSPSFEVDTQVPTFVDATFYDTDSDGSVDEILLEFSEDVDESSVTDTDFNIGATGFGSTTFTVFNSGFPAGNTIDASLTDNYITLVVDLGSTDDQSIAYNQGGLADESGNLAATNAGLTTFDLAPPVLTDVQIEDTDDDALIDRVVYVFSEVVSDADDTDTYVVAEVGSITLPDGQTGGGFVDGDIGVSNDGTFGYVTINNITGQVTQNTGIGSLNVSGVNGFWDDDQNLTSIGDGSEGYIDAANPVIINVTVVNNSTVDVEFSEPVWGNAAANTEVVASNFAFTLTGGLGSPSVDEINDTGTSDPGQTNNLVGGETEIRAFISYTGTPAGGETLTMNTDGGIYDNALNTAAATQFTPLNQDVLVTPTTPIIESVTWLDQNNDGDIDAVSIKIDIDYDIDENGGGDNSDGLNCFNITDNGVTITQDGVDYDNGGGNGGGGHEFAAVPIVVTFAGDPISGTSIADLQVTYVNGTEDEVESELTGDEMLNGVTPLQHFDGAAPRFSNFSATILDDDADGNVDRILVAAQDNIDDTAIDPSEFTYNGVAATGIANSDNDDESFTLTFNGNGTAVEGDFVYTPGVSLVDTAANASNGGTINAASITDGAGPVILNALTLDTDATPNGFIDEILVTFSEDLDNIYGDDTFFAVYEGADVYTVVSATPGAANQVTLAITEGAYTGNIPAWPASLQGMDTYITPDIDITAGYGDDAAGALTPVQTFTNTSDGADPYSTVDLQNTGNGNPTSDTSPEITGTIDDPSATVIVSVDNNTLFATNNADGTWTLPDNSFVASGIGDFAVILTTVDASGNVGTDVTPGNELTVEGGANISGPTLGAVCIGTGYVALGQIEIEETGNGDFGSSGTILLTLPEGFEFDTSIPADFGNSNGLPDISVVGSYVGTATLKLTITQTGTTGLDILRIDDLEVQAVGSAVTNGKLLREGGTADLLTTDTDYADVTSLATEPILTYLEESSVQITEYVYALDTPSVNIQYSGLIGVFTNGEDLTFSGGAAGTMVSGTNTGAAFDVDFEDITNVVGAGEQITGVSSGATATISATPTKGSPILAPFTLIADPGSETAVWYDDGGTPINVDSGGDAQQTTADNTELGISAPGLYTYDIAVDNGMCENTPFRFNVLIYDDLDGFIIAGHSFRDRSFINTQDRDTIFLTEPTNHTVTLVGTGISGETQSSNNASPDYKMYFFDPELAGVGVHTITFTTTNDNTGESISLTADFTVTLPIEFFEEISLPTEVCISDLPITLTVDKTAFTAGQDLNFVQIQNNTQGDPNVNRFWYAFNNDFPGYTGVIATSNYVFDFDFRASNADPFDGWARYNHAHELPDGSAYAFLVYRYLKNPTLNTVDNIFVYGTPAIELTNVNDVYCDDDAEFTLQRTASYVTGFTEVSPGNEFTRWIPNQVTDEVLDITTGYELWTESVPGSGIYNVQVGDFTAGGSGIVNEFDPSDPNRNGNTTEDESGNYRIIFTSEVLTPAGCEGTDQIDFSINPPRETLTLDAATMTSGGATGFIVNVSPDPGVDANEYLLEYCVGDVLASFTVSDDSQIDYSRNGSITYTPGPAFLVGEIVVGLTTGAKAVISTDNGSTMTIEGIVGDFEDGEIIRGNTSLASGPSLTYNENVLIIGETVNGLTSGASAVVDDFYNGFIELSGHSGTFLAGEVIQGATSFNSFNVNSVRTDITWYNESEGTINALTNDYTIPASANGFGVNIDASNTLRAEETVTLFFSSTSIYGCESDLRKVVIEVYDIPEAPILSNAEATEISVDLYEIDYCDGDTFIDLDFDDLSGFTNAEYFASLRYYASVDATPGVTTPTSTVAVTGLGADDFIDLNSGALSIGASGLYEYQITRREHFNSSSNFMGCLGATSTVRVYVNPVTVAPTATDIVSLGSTILHVCEDGAFADIRFQASGIDEYVLYDVDGTTEIARINNGETVSQTTIELQAVVSNFDTDGSAGFGQFDFRLSRIAGANTSTGFEGCESASTIFTIEVHEIDETDIPSIASSDYTDLDTGDPDFYDYAVCLSELDASSTLTATSSFGGPKEFVWYEVDNASGDNPVEITVAVAPTFNELGMNSTNITSAETRYFEITQRFDTDDFAAGEACEIPTGSIVSVVFSEQDDLDISNIADGENFCTEDANFTLDLQASNGGPFVSVADANIVSYEIANAADLSVIETATDLLNGVGNPTTDFLTWHEAATGTTRDINGDIVGGASSSIQITMTYEDPNANCLQDYVNTIIINPDPSIDFDIADGTILCYDNGVITLSGFDNEKLTVNGGGNFTINTSGLGITQADNTVSFDPAAAHQSFHGSPANPQFATRSSHDITFTYEDGNTCEYSITKTIFVDPIPEVNPDPIGGNVIQSSNSCALGNLELFVDMVNPVSNYTFTWFVNGEEIDATGDVGVDPNDSELEYDLAGQASANFRVEITDVSAGSGGCSFSSPNQSISVGQAPIPTISWVGITAGNPLGTTFFLEEDNAVLDDSDVIYTELLIDGIASLPDNGANVPITYNHNFNTAGTHTLELTMRTTSGCEITVNRNINILPHYTGYGDDSTYLQSFENAQSFTLDATNGGWHIETLTLDGKYDTLENSWQRGSANVPGTVGLIDGSAAVYNFNSTSGTNGYGSSEVSFIYTPSFDLSQFTAPTVGFLCYEDFETFRDGAVFQYSTDDGRSWNNVGTFDDSNPIEELKSTPGWYNREAITSSPGTQASGTSGAITSNNIAGIGWADQANDWEEAKAPIDVPSSNYVRFRFALAAQAGTKSSNGFAFDRFSIYNREQVALIEIFSTSLVQSSLAANSLIDTEPEFSGNDLLKINYFTDLANGEEFEVDLINQRNPSGPSSKSAFYGVAEVPTVAISGTSTYVDMSVTPDPLSNVKARLSNSKLNDPAFVISIVAAVNNGNLEVSANFVANTAFNSRDKVALMLVVVEPTVTLPSQTGEYAAGAVVQNVFRKFLPSAAGQYEQGPIASGETRSIQTVTWPISNMYDPSSLRVIAYAQDLETKQIYQAASMDLATGLSSNVLGLEDLSDFKVYPNPADKEVTIEFANGLNEDTKWVIFDQSGKEVMKGFIERGTATLTVVTSDMPSGMYFINLSGEDGKQHAKRIMIVH